MDEKPKRRWFRFSLRTLLVVVAMLSVPLAWVASPHHWIRQRRAAEAEAAICIRCYKPMLTCPHDPVIPPTPLERFGEVGFSFVLMKPGTPADRVLEVARLFPEAYVGIGNGSDGEGWYIVRGPKHYRRGEPRE